MSNTFSKPTTSSNLYFQMPVHKLVSTEMDYDTFCDRFMSQRCLPPMTETDEEYEKRCEEAWSKLVDAQRHKGYHEFPEGYEDDEGEDELQQEMDDYINDIIGTDEDDEYASLENAERRKVANERQMRIDETARQITLLKKEHDEKVLKLNQSLNQLLNS
jgi:hypothetical protein